MSGRLRKVLLVGTALLAASGCSFDVSLGGGTSCPRRPTPPPVATPGVHLFKVVDGDTLEVVLDGRFEKVRMVGIDAPEVERNARLKEQAAAAGVSEEEVIRRGQEVAQTLKDFFARPIGIKKIRLVWPDGRRQRDIDGRLLAYVELEGQDVGELLLRERLVTLREEFPHPRLDRYRHVLRWAEGESAPPPDAEGAPQ